MTHLSTGLTAQASAEKDDVYAACDAALSRLEKQLRRYKRRLKDHHRRRKEPIAQMEATAYLLRGDVEREDVEQGDLGEVVSEPPDARSEPTRRDAEQDGCDEALWAPAIVAESVTSVPKISVGEAVMQLELSSAPFVLFWDDARQRVNLVYRREDGHVGWIDPQPPT